jgi:leucyl aminopeptidase (aminopeptidase T)
MESLKHALKVSAYKALHDYLRVAATEKILLVYDKTTIELAESFKLAAVEKGINITLRRIEITGGNGQDPDSETCAMFLQYPVIIAPAFYSMTHCAAVKKARDAGSRVATLPGITDDIFCRGMKTEPMDLKKIGNKWISKLIGIHKVNVRSEKGTDISFNIGKYKFQNDDGCIWGNGECGNLPAGEVYAAPDPETAEGTIVVDGSIATQSANEGFEHAIIRLRKGSAYSFEGKRAENLRDKLQAFGPKAFVLAEFGIGTNPFLKLSGNLLEDEKIKGTVHFAFGNNCGFGGSNDVPVHIDCMVLSPDIFIGDKCLMKKGQNIIENE